MVLSLDWFLGVLSVFGILSMSAGVWACYGALMEIRGAVFAAAAAVDANRLDLLPPPPVINGRPYDYRQAS